MHQTIAEQIRACILNEGPGWVFTPADFSHIQGKKGSVERALARLAERGSIKRLRKGLYYYPKSNPLLGELSPEVSRVVEALQREKNAIVVPAGATAAHQAGLTTQVPARLTYWTNMNSKTEQIGKQVINFKHVSPRKLSGAGTQAGLILNALEYLGNYKGLENRLRQLAFKMKEEEVGLLKEAAKTRSARVQKPVTRLVRFKEEMNEQVFAA